MRERRDGRERRGGRVCRREGGRKSWFEDVCRKLLGKGRWC
jgi:hypothetical protein